MTDADASSKTSPADRLKMLHIGLSMLDPKMLTSPDGKRVDVSLDAIDALISGRVTDAAVALLDFARAKMPSATNVREMVDGD